jgi:hypothetical protein
MTVFHITDNPDFAIDPTHKVLGWGLKNCSPCEEMQGVMYVTDSPAYWVGKTIWSRGRKWLVTLEVASHADVRVISPTESIVMNLDALSVTNIEEMS